MTVNRRHFIKVLGTVAVLAALPAPLRGLDGFLRPEASIETHVWDDYTKQWIQGSVTGWDAVSGEVVAVLAVDFPVYATKVRVRAGPLLIESKYHGINLLAGDTLELTIATRDKEPVHRLTTYAK